MRILIVNDDPDIAETLHTAIEQAFRKVFVTVVLSGAAGLQLLRDDPSYSVILCDPDVRGMDARAFLAQAREVAPQTAQVVMAATSPERARTLAAEVGADALLLKPFSMVAMQQALSVLLGARGASTRQQSA